MKRLFSLSAVLCVTSLAVLAGPAAADPVGTLCGSVNVTVNGQSLISQAQCQVLPPQ